MRIVLIGNGLSSQIFIKCMKAKCMNTIEFIVLEKNSSLLNRGIDDVPFYFNHILKCYQDRFSRITVSMGIYDGGKIYYSGNNEFSQKYSLKVIGEETDNTIKFIEHEKKAYVFKDEQGREGRKMSLYNTIFMENQDCKFIYDSEVFHIELNNKIIHYRTKGHKHQLSYDFCISTIPLPELNYISNCFSNYMHQFKSHPIHVVRCHLKDDKTYKVIYCTDDDIRFSRIAKLNDCIYFESSEIIGLDSLNSKEEQLISSNFGDIPLANWEGYTIYPGRFKQLDDKISDGIIDLYKKNNIFLLGRMANWKFKLVEDLFDDSEAMCEQILLSYINAE